MPIPTPGSDEKQNDFISRCIKSEMEKHGDMESDQAAAICYKAWRGREGLEEQLPVPKIATASGITGPGERGEKQYEFMARCVPAVQAQYKNLDNEGATALCFTLWSSRYESIHPADAMILEASDADWSKVDKTRLPASCFLWVEDPEKKGTWHLPVYMGAGKIGKDGMYLERGEINLNALRAAASAIEGGRTGKKMNVPESVKARLKSLLKQYDIGQECHYQVYREPVLQESGEVLSRLVEAIQFTGAEFVEEEGARIVKNVVLLGEQSSHGYSYKQEAMVKAVTGKLYEGCRIFINHAKEGGRDLMHLAGVFRNTRHEAGKVKGDAYLLPDDFGAKFWNIAKTMPEAASCSHVADGKLIKDGEKKQVEEITKVHSVDLVVQGATTHTVFEDEKPTGEPIMELKDIKLEDLRTARPDLTRQLVLEGAKTRDEEIQALISEKQALTTEKTALIIEKENLTQQISTSMEEKRQLQARLEETNVRETMRQKEAIVAKVMATLPEHARTDAIKKLCLEAKTGKDGFDEKLFEAAVIELVQPIAAICELAGVRNMGGRKPEGQITTAAEVAKILKLSRS